MLALPVDEDGAPGVTGTGLGGRLIVVGAEPGDVARIADASVRTFLTVTLGG